MSMYKYIFPLLVAVCASTVVFPCWAQKLPAGLGRFGRQSGSLSREASALSIIKKSVEMTARQAVLAAQGATRTVGWTPDGVFYDEEGNSLRRSTRTARLPLPAEKAPWVKGIFRAYPKDQLTTHAYSGFVFKTEGEVFGVVAAHTISPDYTESELGPFFTARFLIDGQIIDIPAEIVQVSAPSMLDIALVKFRPEDEKLFHPFTLAEEEPSLGETLQGIGFSHNRVAFMPKRRLLENTLISLRTDMVFPRVDRPGLCGGPVLNQNGEVVGVHTGSKRAVEDIGFATKAGYLQMLVAAYRQQAQLQTLFPLRLGAHHVADLNVNEYVSAVNIQDENGNIVWRHSVSEKFPYNTILKQLPRGRYIELDISRVWWMGQFLMQSPANARKVRYDLIEERAVEPAVHHSRLKIRM